ncbi:MAG: SDR family NAD(P)-dependent oxidoreductase [Oscillospiraceae bacterium]|nr:SDR family NAD(P)-dependent oxidoreductase [Oscillospiraceae bacterium]
MKQRFLGKNVLITGASSGIGRATALEFAREGASLALVARNEERLNAVAAECRALGARAEIYLADTSEQKQIKAAVDAAVSALGGLDVLHCNAGIYLRCAAKDLRAEQLRRIMETNYFGTLNTVYAALPYFLERCGGSIVTTISMDGKKGVPPDAAYVSSKFALNGFMQVLRQELRPLGIHVGTVFPSRTDTPQIAHVDCPRITPKADPSLVAKGVVRCVHKRKREVLVPGFSCKLLVLADAVSPALGDWMVRAFRLDGVQNGAPAVKEAGL